jgi:hypothetical protein
MRFASGISALALISAARHAGVKRVLVVGGAGSLLIAPGVALNRQPGFSCCLQGQSLRRAILSRRAAHRDGTRLELPLAVGGARARRAHGQVPPGRR